VVLKNLASRNAVSGVMERLPRMSSFTRTRVTPMASASCCWLKLKGSRNSYRSISPGRVGRLFLGNVALSFLMILNQFDVKYITIFKFKAQSPGAAEPILPNILFCRYAMNGDDLKVYSIRSLRTIMKLNCERG